MFIPDGVRVGGGKFPEGFNWTKAKKKRGGGGPGSGGREIWVFLLIFSFWSGFCFLGGQNGGFIFPLGGAKIFLLNWGGPPPPPPGGPPKKKKGPPRGPK